MAGPQKLSPTHLQIARWLLENPGKGCMGRCAQAFNVTQGWLSCIVHSDAFQAHLKELEAEADTLVVADIPSKLRGLAGQTIDALADSVEAAAEDSAKLLHRSFLSDTLDMTLKNLGYGVKPTGPALQASGVFQQNNFYGPVDPKVLAGAREKLLNAQPMEVPALEVSEASQLPPGESADREREVQR